MASETELYQPIKTFLEGQGYVVKGEIGRCDLVALRGDEDPVVVELKTRFSLALLFQAVERLAITETVYVAIAVSDGDRTLWGSRQRDILRLCRQLGIGLLTVHTERMLVEPRLDPGPYQRRQNKPRRARLLREFARRVGDPTTGGINRRPVITAYRQDALRCADLLARRGPLKLSQLRDLSGVVRAGGILQRDVYGWFDRVERGVYTVSPQGRHALELYGDAVAALQQT